MNTRGMFMAKARDGVRHVRRPLPFAENHAKLALPMGWSITAKGPHRGRCEERLLIEVIREVVRAGRQSERYGSRRNRGSLIAGPLRA